MGYLEMLPIDAEDHLVDVFSTNLIVASQEPPQLLGSEMFEWTAVVLPASHFIIDNLMAGVW